MSHDVGRRSRGSHSAQQQASGDAAVLIMGAHAPVVARIGFLTSGYSLEVMRHILVEYNESRAPDRTCTNGHSFRWQGYA